MKFKLIIAIVSNESTDDILEAAREAGATGATIITSCRGEGLNPSKTFLGLDFEGARDVLLFLVVDDHARLILEAIGHGGSFHDKPGAGIAFALDIADAIGLETQIKAQMESMGDEQ